MQILVVVANIQVRSLKTEVEKGSMGTAVGHGLVDPKDQGSSVKAAYFVPGVRKGNRLIFRYRHVGGKRQRHELRDVSRSPGESFLFSFTA